MLDLDSLFRQFVQAGRLVPPEIASLGVLVFALMTLRILNKHFGCIGLNVYNVLTICLANIQILQVTQYSVYTSPMPLGTVLFTTLFLSNTYITELYGEAEARQGTALGILAYAFFGLSMLLSLTHQPALGEADFLVNAQLDDAALLRVFVPSARFFTASLVSFGVSQWVNVWIFQWLRMNQYASFSRVVSMVLASLVDNIVFSYTAFVVLAHTPVPQPALWSGYILGSLGVRFVVVGLVLTVQSIGTHKENNK